MRRPEMMAGALSQSAGRLGASEHLEIDPTDGSVVHLVLACTPCGVRRPITTNMHSYSKPETKNQKPKTKTSNHTVRLMACNSGSDDPTASYTKPIKFLTLFADDVLHLSESPPFV